MGRYSGRADRGGKVAALHRTLLADGSRRQRDEAHRLLDGRNVRVALAGEGGKHRHQRELLRRQRRFPRLLSFRPQVHVARNTNLSAAHAQRFHLAQRRNRLAAAPEHHADFQILQTLHSILSPFLLLDSSINRASRTANADSSGGHRSGFRPDATQEAKYSSSASNPSLALTSIGISIASAR